MAKAKSHKDVEFAVDDAAGNERTFRNFDEAAAFAVALAASGRPAVIDVLVYSAAGARFYGGDEAVHAYREDPERSVFDRYVVNVEYIGSIA